MNPQGLKSSSLEYHYQVYLKFKKIKIIFKLINQKSKSCDIFNVLTIFLTQLCVL